MCQGCAQDFSLGVKIEGPKIKAKGREQGCGFWEVAASPSPEARGSGEGNSSLVRRVTSPNCPMLSTFKVIHWLK